MARKAEISAIVLEVNEVPNKEGKTYPKLVMFETGQRYPQVLVVSLKPEQVSTVKPLVGKLVNVDVEISEYQGRVNYYYTGVSGK